ncbi:MAG: response regulator transcription factor [Chloroflexi bacterium]|nr:response regulator transcription factor [Chloroflexota bacterium]
MLAIIITDNEEDREFLAFVVRQTGLAVNRSGSVLAVAKRLLEHPADLILLAPQTINVANADIAALREVSQAPILVLTETAFESEHCQLLDSGADLVLKRPFSPQLLTRYMRMFLQRSGSVPVSVLSNVESSGIVLTPETRTVQTPNAPSQRLTLLEFRLMYIFITNSNQVIPIDVIVERVWGYDGAGNRELVRGLIRRLRRKIEPNPKEPQYIHNLPGIGYRFGPK